MPPALRHRPEAATGRLLAGLSACLLAGLFALCPGAVRANTPSPAPPDMQQMYGGFCPRPLGDDAALPPTLRVAMLWRQATPAEQMAGRSGTGHPSQARNMPGYAAEAAKNPRARLDGLSWDAGTELLAGRHELAQQQLASCLKDAVAQRDTEAEAACANNLGVLLAARGRYPEAQAEFERAMTRYREALAEADARPAETIALPFSIPGMEAMMMNSAVQMKRLGPATGLLRTALNQGQLALSLGRLAPAERHMQEALASAATLPGACRTVAASDLARLYRRLGRSDDAARVLASHPLPTPLYEGAGASVDGVSGDMGRVALAPSATQAPTATAPAQALPAGFPQQWIAANDEPMSLGSAAGLQGLLAAAARDEQAGRSAQALAGYGRAAQRALALRLPEAEISARAGLMRVQAAAGRTGAAIAHGKRAVTLVQALHQGEAGAQLDRATRRTLLRERQQVPMQLVRLLLDRQRLPEAELVLQTLKQDEGLQFRSRLDAATAVVLPESAAEQAARARSESAGAELLRLDAERRAAATGLQLGLLQMTRAGIEQVRLQAAGDVIEFLRAPGANTTETELRRAPTEARELLQRLTAGQGEKLLNALRHLAEDAPQFTDTRASAAQLATVAEAARRAVEFHTAFAPFVASLMKEPGLSGSAWGQAQGPAPAPSLDQLPTAMMGMLNEAMRRLASGGTRPARTPAPAAASGRPGRTLQAALAGIDVAEALWRLDQQRERAEARHLAAEAEAAAALEAPPSLPAIEGSAVTLARLAPGAALLHYLPGEDRTDVLLVTARGYQSLRVTVPRARLDALVARLLLQLRQPRQDPRPVARELHDVLFAPLRPALDAAGTQVVVLSLHGRLRFLPFAALHDGRQWLAERHALVVQPGARIADLLRPTSPRWRIAAFGAAAGGAGLPPLPAVRSEVRNVVGEGRAQPRGRAWVDGAFDAPTLRQALAGQHDVLHIASHFHFEPGDAAASFLLLGDGSRLSLQELGSERYRFDKLELVTLSACQTGLSEDDAYGQEIDGLAALLMAQGARAVVASLWQVADDSTGELMATLYRLREAEGTTPLPLAQALQRAQLAMIRGVDGAAGADGTDAGAAGSASRGAQRVVGGADSSALPARAHPYHWAPFVLMGNWR